MIGTQRIAAIIEKNINFHPCGFLLWIIPIIQIANPSISIDNPIISVSMPNLPYNRGVNRKRTIPIAITIKEAIINLPNLFTIIFIPALS